MVILVPLIYRVIAPPTTISCVTSSLSLPLNQHPIVTIPERTSPLGTEGPCLSLQGLPGPPERAGVGPEATHETLP